MLSADMHYQIYLGLQDIKLNPEEPVRGHYNTSWKFPSVTTSKKNYILEEPKWPDY